MVLNMAGKISETALAIIDSAICMVVVLAWQRIVEPACGYP